MDHSHHMDMDMGHNHGDMDMGGGQCNMNMLFTWSSKDLCIIFRQWRVTGPFSLFVSLVVIVLLTAGYEGVRKVTRRYEAMHGRRLSAFTAVTGNDRQDIESVDDATAPDSHNHHPPSSSNHAGLPLLVGSDTRRALEHRGKIVLALLYAVQVFYSFFIMLLFMTYNGSVMLAVAVGAFVGYLVFGEDTTAAKTVACH
ncbi:low-affinity Cu transporter [Aspergillus candidus]|uniref:Copper transport protein n=1 Tax=Aspergillus candidus TaxID=41067 RepID=A0A2I2FCI6_ASPCN|nr:Ctr copper transporter [Aspergillus candidus]PLB38343.1 Ctr copper transporter [Aspergillus candidus]